MPRLPDTSFLLSLTPMTPFTGGSETNRLRKSAYPRNLQASWEKPRLRYFDRFSRDEWHTQ